MACGLGNKVLINCSLIAQCSLLCTLTFIVFSLQIWIKLFHGIALVICLLQSLVLPNVRHNSPIYRSTILSKILSANFELRFTDIYTYTIGPYAGNR